jgi:hypothetical protein
MTTKRQRQRQKQKQKAKAKAKSKSNRRSFDSGYAVAQDDSFIATKMGG